MEKRNKIPKEGRNLSQTTKRSAKYRNKKGPAKYFKPYKNLDYIIMDEEIVPDDVTIPISPLHDELNPKIWNYDNTLKIEVRQALIDIANSYFKSLELDFAVNDILFTGSLANYGWTNESDIDLHLIVDYQNLKNIPFLEDYLYLKKKNWIDNHNISIYGFEVEPFAKDEEAKYDYKAIYSIMNNDWVIPPKKDKPIIDFETIKEKTASLMNDIDMVIDIKDIDKQFKVAEKIKNKLGGLRSIGLQKSGEYSNENLIYKTLRRAGYLEKIQDIKNDVFDKKLSLNESINEKSLSKSQQRFFGAVKNCQDTGKCGSKSIKKTSNSMSKSDIDDFASTKIKGLPEKVKENVEFINLGVTPMVHTLKIQNGIDGMTPEKISIIKDFINFVSIKLKISKPVNVCLRNSRDEYIATTASYVPSDNENHVKCGKRAIVDILRSLAHELVHNRQRELNMFGVGESVKNIGGHIEDQANSVAGIFIKDFTHNYGYDNIYDL